MLWLLQLPAPMPVQTVQAVVTAPVHVSIEWSPATITAVGTVAVLILGALATGIVKVITAIGLLRETKTQCELAARAAQEAKIAVVQTGVSIDKIDKQTNGRLALIEDQKKLLVLKLEEITAHLLTQATTERNVLATKLAAAEADVLRRADAAPAIPPEVRQVRKGDVP